MAFHQKLNLLMDQFHISNSKLSKELNVDASLVSRWRNGQRIPSTRSAHLPIIASYFLTQHGYSYKSGTVDSCTGYFGYGTRIWSLSSRPFLQYTRRKILFVFQSLVFAIQEKNWRNRMGLGLVAFGRLCEDFWDD